MGRARETRRNKRIKGFTLLELLVVLAILGMLAALVGPQVLNQLGGAKSKSAAIQISDLEQALELYKLDVGKFPSSEQGLNALVRHAFSWPLTDLVGTAALARMNAYWGCEAHEDGAPESRDSAQRDTKKMGAQKQTKRRRKIWEHR